MKQADLASIRPSRNVARSVTLAALSVVVAVGAGCYETTPHRVEVAARVAAPDCAATIADVFAGAGFVQLPTPPRRSMFFGPRVAGPYSPLLRSRSGVSVTLAPGVGADCHVTLEALSPDASCPSSEESVGGPPLLCGPGHGFFSEPASPGTGSPTVSRCGPMPQALCELTSAPSPDNDAAVDELARRLRVALGPKSRVN